MFLHNLRGHSSIVNALATNEDNVLFSGGDNGSITFWDYDTGYAFQVCVLIKSLQRAAAAQLFGLAHPGLPVGNCNRMMTNIL